MPLAHLHYALPGLAFEVLPAFSDGQPTHTAAAAPEKNARHAAPEIVALLKKLHGTWRQKSLNRDGKQAAPDQFSNSN
jgi:hypothetical protein